MATDSILDRIDTVDFFAVLPAGFYSVTMMAFSLTVPPGAHNMIDALSPLAGVLKDNPVYFVFWLFAAYLVGSIARALRVTWAERVSPPFRSDFPFPEKLRETLENLKTSPATRLDATRIPDIRNGLSNDEFNYWKDVLCTKTKSGFEYYQTFESRVRFSAGMVWAGVIGVVVAVFMFFRCPGVAWQMLLVSITVYAAFGLHLRRVREQEAKALLFLYLAYLQS